MRGSSHLAIGLITGVAVAGLAPGVPASLAGVALAGFSALAPDLDHPESRLSQRLGFAQHYVRWAFVVAALVIGAYSYLHLRVGGGQRLYYLIALGFGLLGASLQGGAARRLALLFTGLGTGVAGLYAGQVWLSLLGAFIALAPFTSHRSWTHTVWATAFWTYVGYLAEHHLGWRGVALFAGGGYASHLVADTLTKAGVRWLFPLLGYSFKIPLIRTGSATGNVLEVGICAGYALLVLGLIMGKIGF